MIPIYTAPATHDGNRTLQATAANWRSVATAMEQHAATVGIRQRMAIQHIAATIRAGIDDDAPVSRITLPDADAVVVLHVAGVNA